LGTEQRAVAMPTARVMLIAGSTVVTVGASESTCKRVQKIRVIM
jgi:hypothetical protein